MRPLRGAFTLIEVLVVLVILAAIAAIVFPVFARVRESGRRTKCISNLHQIGLALKMYREDWDGQEARYGVRLSHSDLGLPYSYEAVVPYIRDQRIMFCPSDTRDLTGWGATYWIGFTGNEISSPDFDWEALAAKRGPDYPLATCPSHNGHVFWEYMHGPPVNKYDRYSWETFVYLVLRIDGRVNAVRFPADQIPTVWFN